LPPFSREVQRSVAARQSYSLGDTGACGPASHNSEDSHIALAETGSGAGKDADRAFAWRPPDVREWLPADHLAWFVIDAAGEMDLVEFCAVYRADGRGRAAYEPSVTVALILYAFATSVRSSQAIERHCHQDVAYRVMTGNLVPDHATIARLRALAELFAEG
jgi:hypothetical protein